MIACQNCRRDIGCVWRGGATPKYCDDCAALKHAEARVRTYSRSDRPRAASDARYWAKKAEALRASLAADLSTDGAEAVVEVESPPRVRRGLELRFLRF